VSELEVRERPPSTLRNALTTGPRKVPELEVRKLETWMADPLGGAGGRFDSGHHQSWRHRWQGPWGVLAAGLAATTTEVGDVDGGLPGGAGGRFSSDHHH
jgi:hypothetical protein